MPSRARAMARVRVQRIQRPASTSFHLSQTFLAISLVTDAGPTCPRLTPPGPTFHLITGFGANHNFGGFPGAQCCASRGNGVNPMSGPDGLEVSADGNTLFVGNGSSSVVVFDLTTMNLSTSPPTPPTILATIPTGVSADYDGPQGISGCVASWNGEAGSATDCGDDRADEMSFDNVHHVLAIINGDPGLPFVTFIDMSHVVSKTGTSSNSIACRLMRPWLMAPIRTGQTTSSD